MWYPNMRIVFRKPSKVRGTPVWILSHTGMYIVALYGMGIYDLHKVPCARERQFLER